jgi:hypothetical protein
MDPAALGTTMIGLDRIRAEEEHVGRGGQPADDLRRDPTRHRRLSARRQLAAALRGAARRVEPRSTAT